MLTHLQENYSQLMPHKLLEYKDIVKETTYNPQYLIVTVFSAVEELLEFSNITRTLYTQLQAVNISYVIVHKTGKFVLVIFEWNLMSKIQKTWFRFKQFYWTPNQELRETLDITVEDAVIHNGNMVRNVVTGLQEVLQQEQVPTETPTFIEEPFNHVANAVQNTHQQLVTNLQQMQAMIQAIHMQYAAGPHNAHQDYGDRG